jgi:predicted DNA-binding protein (UPF0251 family)
MPITMPRPFKIRKITSRPIVSCFRPHPAPLYKSEELFLRLDEYQSLKHIELERRDQISSASAMKVSRQTFGVILASARRKLAEAVVNGKTLRIGGGPGNAHCPPIGEKTYGTYRRK